MTVNDFTIRRLGCDDTHLMGELLTVFARAFNDSDTYNLHRPTESYTRTLLSTDTFIALVALHEGIVIGGVAAYELKKFEQNRSEIYVYDLAVNKPYRRQGVASGLLRWVTEHAVTIGAHAVFIQADKEDYPAIALYDSIGVREEVFHYDLHLSRNP